MSHGETNVWKFYQEKTTLIITSSKYTCVNSNGVKFTVSLRTKERKKETRSSVACPEKHHISVTVVFIVEMFL